MKSIFGLALLLLSSSAAYAGDVAGRTPAGLYEEGVEYLYSGQYPEADKAFEAIRTHHPYCRYAALAELRQADAHRLRTQPLQAIEAYRSFLKYHPGHAQADYARLQVAECYHSMLPSSWGILPPPAEKDQDAARQAIVAYDAFLSHARPAVAGSLPQARRHRRTSIRQLADHELYVARFYFRRQHYAAAAGRAELILQNFSEVGLDAEALWLAGKARAELGEASTARIHLDLLVQKHPGSPRARQAREELGHLAKATQTPAA